MNMCNNWVKHILELKQNCSQKMLSKIENDISSSMNILLDPSANEKKLLQLQNNIMNEENNRSKIKQSLLENQFEEFKTQTRDLLEKEDVYEKKLEDQERQRIDGEESSMKRSAEKEQKIANQLLNDIQNIAITDTNYNIKEQSIKREMKNMMQEVENNIVLKRQKLLNRIQRMRTLHDLNQRKSGKDLLNMKRELGKKINLIAKTGNPSQCFMKNPYAMNNYCKLNFEDFQLQLECKNEKQFCYICCDNEIGTLKKENLDCCYNRCDEVNSVVACMAFEQKFIQMMPIGVPVAHPALAFAPPPLVLPIDPSFNTA